MAYQQQYLHSSVIPRLTNANQQRKPRPISDATSIASSVDFSQDEIEFMAATRLSKAPVYKYSNYEDMDIAEDDIEEEDSDADSIDSLYSKTQRMNSWLGESNRRSNGRSSVGSDAKTASSYDEVTTPKTPPPDFGSPMEMKQRPMTVGPRGPHLFRSMSSSSAASDPDFEEYATPISPIKVGTPLSMKRSPSILRPPMITEPTPRSQMHLSVEDVNHRPMSSLSMAIEGLEESEIERWSPFQVCSWMHDLGFDEALIDKFRMNDISGAILMHLQWEDLKELDIQSFGKRIELWSELNHLRKSPAISNHSPTRQDPFEAANQNGHTPPMLSRHASKKSRESNYSQISSHNSSPTVRASNGSFSLTPTTLASVRGFSGLRVSTSVPEGTTPEIKLSSTREDEVSDASYSDVDDDDAEYEDEDSFQQEQPEEYEEVQATPSPISPNSGLHARRNRQLPQLSIITPANGLHIVSAKKSAGSVGSNGKPKFAVNRNSKRKVRLSHHGAVTPLSPSPRMVDIVFAAPTAARRESLLRPGAAANRRASMLAAETPVWGAAPSLCASSDVLGPRDKTNFALREDEVRRMPKVSAQEQINKFLTLQHLQSLEERVQSPPATAGNQSFNDQMGAPPMMSPRNLPLPQSPGFSGMTTDNHRSMVPPPSSASRPPPNIQRSISLKTFSHQRPARLKLSNTFVEPGQMTAGFVRPVIEEDFVNPLGSPKNFIVPLKPVSPEKKQPQYPVTAVTPQISAPVKQPAPSVASGKSAAAKSQATSKADDPDWEDASSHSSGPPSPASERIFAGEMKKRTNNWLRHEWTTHRVELKGTRLTVFKNSTSREVLATIEMDDYTVSCATAGTNKFGRSLKATGKKDSEGNYNFQLMPNSSSKGNGEPKKEHHFSVNSREERIDWMRELMLSKAIKQKKSGFQVEVNGRMM